MADVALQRKNMVESQIRPSDVTDRRITTAMTAIPREKFLPARLASLAYSDESLMIAPGRETLPPVVLAKLIQLAEFEAGDNVLVISESAMPRPLWLRWQRRSLHFLPTTTGRRLPLKHLRRLRSEMSSLSRVRPHRVGKRGPL